MNNIVKEAINILRTTPYDAAHGEAHHKAVWNNVLWLIQKENLTVDREALEIAAWWHDVDKGLNDDPHIIETLRRHYVPQQKIDAILAIVRQHSFEDTQTTIEGKVLFDADKLEYVSLTRWKKFLTKMQKNPAEQPTWEAYKKALQERIIPVYLRLNFQATKRRFVLDYQEFRQWYDVEFTIALPPLPTHST